MALYHGIKWILELGIKKVIVESNSALAIATLEDPINWKRNHKSRILTTVDLLKTLKNGMLNHTVHEANKSAHWIAQKGLYQTKGFHAFTVIPHALLRHLYNDYLGSLSPFM